MTYSFVCPHCQRAFKTNRPDQIYCSKPCAGHSKSFDIPDRYLVKPDRRCFFSPHIPLEEIERLMEEKQVERTQIGT